MKIIVGQMNTLEVVREIRGAWVLTDGEDSVHLPSEEAPWDIDVGGDIEVFVYTNRGVRTATTRRPAGTVGQFVCLEVVDIAEAGVFCAWGLDKDLLIPNNKIHSPLKIGDRVVVAIVLDRDQRIMGVSWLQKYFRTDTSRLQLGQRVNMMVYGETDRGFLVVVEDKWGGMLFFDQTHRDLEVGLELPGFITGIRDDARLDLSLSLPVPKHEALHGELKFLAEEIKGRGGFLPLTDKSSPDDIRRELRMSKKAFKRAVGGLYKTHKIQIEDGGIRWK